jgi:hypothetical protein
MSIFYQSHQLNLIDDDSFFGTFLCLFLDLDSIPTTFQEQQEPAMLLVDSLIWVMSPNMQLMDINPVDQMKCSQMNKAINLGETRHDFFHPTHHNINYQYFESNF